MSATNEELLRSAYEAFNARDIEGALALMHPEVDWPNGMEGGRLHGHQEVRDYWRRQFDAIESHVELRHVEQRPDGLVLATVDQIVRERAGRVISEVTVEHRYAIDGGLIRRMDIGSATP